MKVGVVGTRDFKPIVLIPEFLDRLKVAPTEIISGGGGDVDAAAKRWALIRNVFYTEFPADWSLGRRAGPLRNEQIVDASDIIIAFWVGDSPGTRSSLNLARKAGKCAYVVRPDGSRSRYC